MSRLHRDLHGDLRRVLGDPPRRPRSVVQVRVTSGSDLASACREADDLVDAGADLVVLDSPTAEAGVLAALALLLDLEPVAVVPPATGTQWREQVVQVRARCRSARPVLADTTALLAQLDDPLLTRTVGLLRGLATRRTPVLCGGGATTAAAALVAARDVTTQWWLAGSAPALPAAAKAWSALGLQPLLDLGLGDDGADLALALVLAALEKPGA
jgi:nicotinate-nucleotide--dimethylbenzimidazole phosphoribosyltransferase